jgi:uncharacterized membrane protein SirB2
LLFVSGLAMARVLQQYPLVTPWLTAKFGALLAYILLGSVAIKRGHTRGQRLLAGVLALVSLAYLLAVALSRNPLPFLS